MGVKKKPTLKILFRQFAISLIVMLVAAIIVPYKGCDSTGMRLLNSGQEL